jgi:hypothetical protein
LWRAAPERSWHLTAAAVHHAFCRLHHNVAALAVRCAADLSGCRVLSSRHRPSFRLTARADRRWHRTEANPFNQDFTQGAEHCPIAACAQLRHAAAGYDLLPCSPVIRCCCGRSSHVS